MTNAECRVKTEQWSLAGTAVNEIEAWSGNVGVGVSYHGECSRVYSIATGRTLPLHTSSHAPQAALPADAGAAEGDDLVFSGDADDHGLGNGVRTEDCEDHF